MSGEPAVELRRIKDTFHGQPQYEVLLGGEVVGSVHRRSITVERRAKGLSYVLGRRDSKPRYWGISVPGHKDYGVTWDTRKGAVEDVVRTVQEARS